VTELPADVWRFADERLCASSAPFGGGLGLRRWVLNAQVPLDYSRTDVAAHAREVAAAHECHGDGVAMLTASPLARAQRAHVDGIEVYATVGLSRPTWAADAYDTAAPSTPGTVNIVALLPVRLDDAALVNAVITITEAKTQALVEHDIAGTGTASDAVCVVCPPAGPAERFGGPRSHVGAPLARAVHEAVAHGIVR
jgi:adenosylcobinamide hydrolase